MADYLQLLTSYYGNTGDTSPAATGKSGWRRYTNNAGTITIDVSDGTNWVTVSSGGGAQTIDQLTDVDTSTVAPVNNNVLTWNSTGSQWVPAVPPGATGGEANDGANVGTGEGTVYKNKTGTTINLKSLKQGTNVTLTNNTDDVTITSAYPPDSTDAVKGIVELSLANGTESDGGRAVQDNDPRLTDDRNPTAHNHDAVYSALSHNHDVDYSDINHHHDANYANITHNHAGEDINSGTVPAAQLPNASNTVKGAVMTSLANGSESAGTKVILDSDTRLTNSRTPTAHASSHLSDGGDAIAAATTSIRGTILMADNNESAANKAVQSNDTRMSNARTPTAHNHSGADITSGTVGPTVGGTGKATFTQHALLKGGASNAFTEIPVGTENHVLSVVSGTPAYRSLDSERTGKATANGTGSQTEFTIAHGLGSTPSYAFVDCSSHAIARTWTVDGTNITVTFSSAPGSGTANVIIYWRVIA